MTALRRERNGPRSRKRRPESGKHREVGVERYPFQPANAKRGEAVPMLQVSERALDSATARIEVAEPLSVARDARKQPPLQARPAGLAGSSSRPGSGMIGSHPRSSKSA